MHSLWFVQWYFTRRDHPGNLGRVSGSSPVKHSAPSTDVEGPLCQVRVVTILRTSNLINLYTPNNNFLI